MNIEKLKVKTEKASENDQILKNNPALWVALITVGNIVRKPLKSGEEKKAILQEIKLLLDKEELEMGIKKLKVKTKESSGNDHVLDDDSAFWVALVTVSNIVNNPLRSDVEKKQILQEIKLLLLGK